MSIYYCRACRYDLLNEADRKCLRCGCGEIPSRPNTEAQKPATPKDVLVSVSAAAFEAELRAAVRAACRISGRTHEELDVLRAVARLAHQRVSQSGPIHDVPRFVVEAMGL